MWKENSVRMSQLGGIVVEFNQKPIISNHLIELYFDWDLFSLSMNTLHRILCRKYAFTQIHAFIHTSESSLKTKIYNADTHLDYRTHFYLNTSDRCVQLAWMRCVFLRLNVCIHLSWSINGLFVVCGIRKKKKKRNRFEHLPVWLLKQHKWMFLNEWRAPTISCVLL